MYTECLKKKKVPKVIIYVTTVNKHTIQFSIHFRVGYTCLSKNRWHKTNAESLMNFNFFFAHVDVTE